MHLAGRDSRAVSTHARAKNQSERIRVRGGCHARNSDGLGPVRVSNEGCATKGLLSEMSLHAHE
jgi:hypothetical protein